MCRAACLINTNVPAWRSYWQMQSGHRLPLPCSWLRRCCPGNCTVLRECKSCSVGLSCACSSCCCGFFCPTVQRARSIRSHHGPSPGLLAGTGQAPYRVGKGAWLLSGWQQILLYQGGDCPFLGLLNLIGIGNRASVICVKEVSRGWGWVKEIIFFEAALVGQAHV